jgi:hypothetical protein
MIVKDIHRMTTALVVCPECKGHGEIGGSSTFINASRGDVIVGKDLTCHGIVCPVCEGDRVLEEVVILRRRMKSKGRK